MSTPNRCRVSTLSIALSLALSAGQSFAQSQASQVIGRLTNANGEPSGGVEITVTHVDSGTVSRVTTDAKGRYRLDGLRVGGPYTIAASSGGASVSGVYLQVDETARIDLSGAPITLAAVVVAGARQSPDRSGTTLSSDQLGMLPSISRSITDYVRLDPHVVVTNRATNELSVLGQNPRYNSVRVDGVNVGDTFGLETNNLPTPRQPFTLDSLEAISIDAVNYDVAAAGAAGGGINAVTKSGTNEFHGSAFATYRDNDMVRDNTDGSTFTGFNQEHTYGLTFGGPLIQDRLFFFIDAEDFTQTAPAPSYGPIGSSASTIVNVSQANLDLIRSIAQTRWGIDPGVVGGVSSADTTARSWGLKLDWNVTDMQRLSYRHASSDQSQANFPGFAPNSLAFSSYAYQKDFDLDSDTLQWFADWSDRFSTEAYVSNRRYLAERKPASQLPAIGILVNPTAIVFLGTEENSYLNRLETNTWNASFSGNVFLGEHTVKAGIDYEQNDINNLYGRRANGTYAFFGIANFNAGIATPFRFSYPTGGDPSSFAADWQLSNLGAYLQDTWQATDALSLALGLRYDSASTDNPPIYNAGVQTAFGFDNRVTIDGDGLFQPRLSFRYTPAAGLKTVVRGGVGLFRGAAPNVWLSNPYSNTGRNYIDYNFPVFFGGIQPNPDGQIGQVPVGALGGRQSIDLIDPDLSQPSVWKANLAIDQELPFWGATATAELVIDRVREAITYQNLNLGASTATGRDGRPLFWNAAGLNPGSWNQAGTPANSVRSRSLANPAYGDVLLATSTEQGGSAQLSLSLQKPFGESDWAWMAGYTFTDSDEVSPLTSSNSLALWGSRAALNPNDTESSRSNYEIRDRFIGTLSWRHAFFNDLDTSVSMFYEGRAGRPYSYVFQNDANGDGVVGNDLLYVPTGVGDVVFGSAAEQAAFNAMIDNNPYLAANRGHVLSRNSDRSGWVNQFDLRISQELPGFTNDHKAQLWLDVLNIGNLINRNWGHIDDLASPSNLGVVSYGGVCGATVTAVCTAGSAGHYVYRFSTPQQLGVYDERGVSRWSVQIGIRYSF